LQEIEKKVSVAHLGELDNSSSAQRPKSSDDLDAPNSPKKALFGLAMASAFWMRSPCGFFTARLYPAIMLAISR